MMFLRKRLKAIQITGITVSILKENPDTFSAYIFDYLSEIIRIIRSGNFPAILKMLISRLFSKKVLSNLKKTIDQLGFYQLFQKS